MGASKAHSWGFWTVLVWNKAIDLLWEPWEGASYIIIFLLHKTERKRSNQNKSLNICVGGDCLFFRTILEYMGQRAQVWRMLFYVKTFISESDRYVLERSWDLAVPLETRTDPEEGSGLISDEFKTQWPEFTSYARSCVVFWKRVNHVLLWMNISNFNFSKCCRMQ